MEEVKMKVTDVRDGITKATIQNMYNTHIMDNFHLF